ncbi:unnamed protein product [Calicophoron daubneyi]|uniref:Uncharacterized protein n=1 Tax=Calicophoron daubneyi TaxID=300641 RepID=A0AAV2T4E8_CALDB
MGYSSSSSSSSDLEYWYDPLWIERKKRQIIKKMLRRNTCVCGFCPPGVIACGDNFIRRYQYGAYSYACRPALVQTPIPVPIITTGYLMTPGYVAQPGAITNQQIWFPGSMCTIPVQPTALQPNIAPVIPTVSLGLSGPPPAVPPMMPPPGLPTQAMQPPQVVPQQQTIQPTYFGNPPPPVFGYPPAHC